MDSNNENNDHISVTINKPAKVLHFSDGVEEEMEQEVVQENNSSTMEKVDPKNLSWAPWLSYHAWKSGSKVLNAVDYAGEGLANFFGITTPKYQLEIDEHERLQEEYRKLEEESAGWVLKDGGKDLPLVLNEPSKKK